jgi:uncharacterized membrane protein
MHTQHQRYDRLDALRGLAIVWMVVFHFCFDLNYFRFVTQNFNANPLWTWQRTCIVTLFLVCAGLGVSAASSQGQTWTQFWRRWGQVLACAALVSAASYAMFPKTFISFGVLHGLAVMLLIVRCTRSWGPWLWPLGALALVLPHLWGNPFFDTRATNWTGLVTHKPLTEDYVPVLPWLGVVWWANAVGVWFQKGQHAWYSGSVPRTMQALVWLGRRPLSIYMVHQPILIGLLGMVAWLR